MRLLIPSEPGELTLGIVAGAELDLLGGGQEIPSVGHGIGHLLVADGLHGGAGGADAGGEQIREIKTACDQAGRKYGRLRNKGTRGISEAVQRSTERD